MTVVTSQGGYVARATERRQNRMESRRSGPGMVHVQRIWTPDVILRVPLSVLEFDVQSSFGPGPDDVGSPWAIGSKDGGHDAVHPDLGTIKDFDAFVKRARQEGLEVALDLALQAAPDHPWVEAHPEWFTTRADGTIAYAENPPKKYQDIYPVNFDNDPEGIYHEVLRVVRHWMSHGVRIFRVDNPHTKPVEFWDWLLTRVQQTDPDVLFLSEAFTKPAMMRTLATVGFHQSYTYFTWRNAKWELEQYLTELSRETSHVMRPNLFVNTPDILHAYLQYGGPAAFKIRATIAATARGPSPVCRSTDLVPSARSVVSNEPAASEANLAACTRPTKTSPAAPTRSSSSPASGAATAPGTASVSTSTAAP